MNVLYLDDCPEDHVILNASLGGIKVTNILSSKDIHKMNLKKFTHIIIDINLDNECGIRIYTKIRKNTKAKIIMTSGTVALNPIYFSPGDTFVEKGKLINYMKKICAVE